MVKAHLQLLAQLHRGQGVEALPRERLANINVAAHQVSDNFQHRRLHVHQRASCGFGGRGGGRDRRRLDGRRLGLQS